jgi:hypothetical protein
MRHRRDLSEAPIGRSQKQKRQKSMHGIDGAEDAIRSTRAGQFASALPRWIDFSEGNANKSRASAHLLLPTRSEPGSQ